MWIHLLTLRLIDGATGVKAPENPKKTGGDDAPRIEIWETRKQPKAKRKKQPDEFIQEQLAAVAGMTRQEALHLLDEDDEEVFLLLLM